MPLYDQLAEIRSRPLPFSQMTIAALWTEPHIARQMLAFHLDPDIDAASRRHATIDNFVTWLDARLGLAGKSITDLGCGPGLYTERMAQRGAKVSGVDFSASSLAHARQSAGDRGLAITYIEGDYLTADLPEAQDIVTVIYGDFCALAPDQRRRLLARVRAMLAPGGRLVLDAYTPGQFAALSEGFEGGHNYQNGFWSPLDYFAFKQTHLWPDELISLERYLVATAERQFEIFNWMQYFTPASIEAELAEAGFAVEANVEFDTGQPWAGGATPLTVIAGPA